MSSTGVVIFILLLSLGIYRRFPVVLAVWTDITTNGLETNLEKVDRRTDFGPIVEFRFGPFESSNDELYTSERYVESLNVRRQSILEKLRFSDNRSEPKRKQRKTGNSLMLSIMEKDTSDKSWKLSSTKFHEEGTDSDGEPSASSFGALENVLAELRKIKDQMNEIKKLSVFVDGFREANTNEINNNGLSGFGSKNPMHSSVKNSNGSKGGENANWKNHSSNLSRTIANEFKSVNNLTHGNQYQIGNIFIFNQLSDKGKLNIDFGHLPASSFPRELATTIEPDEIVQEKEDVMSEMVFPNDFSRINPEKINQMSRVIDFVERYHGVMGNTTADGKERHRFIRGKSNQKKKVIGETAKMAQSKFNLN